MTALAEVELIHLEGKVERWVRFDRRRRVLAFAPDSVFAFVRWASNDFGTVISRIDIARVPQVGEPFSTIPYVTPGAEILLRHSGWPKVEQVLAAIDQVEALELRAEDACPDHWRHIGNRIAAGEAPRAYTRERHAAWLLRRRITA